MVFDDSIIIKRKTPLVQLVERWFPKPDVIGSIPIGRVLFLLFSFSMNHIAFEFFQNFFFFIRGKKFAGVV